MAPIVVSSCPSAPDVARLAQDRRRGIPQLFADDPPGTLGELRTVSDEASAISKTCAFVLNDSETQESEVDVATAKTGVEATLNWPKFLQFVQTERRASNHLYLFRADLNMKGKIGSYEPSLCDELFNDQYRRTHTVSQFVEAIAEHLGESQVQNSTGIWQDSMFTSMSPILEWAIHTTKNKWSDNKEDERASLVIFDVGKVRQIQGVALFRISDVVRFLESGNKVHLISDQLREWASNCDEYVTMGRAVKKAVIKVIPWFKLQSMSIINGEFKRAYTLRKYRQWRDEREYELHDVEKVGRIIVQSAKVLAGHDASYSRMVQHMRELILKPDVSFWGINTNASLENIRHACVEQELMEGFSKTSLN